MKVTIKNYELELDAFVICNDSFGIITIPAEYIQLSEIDEVFESPEELIGKTIALSGKALNFVKNL